MGLAIEKSTEGQILELAKNIYSKIEKISVGGKYQSLHEIPLYKDIYAQINDFQKLIFILPAFPAKSANREKTVSAAPDLGEVIGLVALNGICQQINEMYAPGAEVVICSDGRVFNDIVMVSDEDLMEYKNGIKEIIRSKNLTHLKTFSLDDCYDHKDFSLMREELEENFAEPLESIKRRVKEDEGFRYMFNGVHRFMKDDLGALKKDLSKNQLMKESKKLAYKVIQRSGAWDRILAKKYPNTLRLSIHPYPQQHRKFGVKLVHSSDRWATPWHNVALKKDGKFTLVKRSQAIELGAQLEWSEGRYAYYQL